MVKLLVLNLCSVLNCLPILILWAIRGFHAAHLSHIALCLVVNPIFCKYLADSSSSHLYRLVKALLSVLFHLFVFVPLFVLLIYLTSIHLHTLQFQSVVHHSLIISTLVAFPSKDRSLISQIVFGSSFAISKDRDKIAANKFAIVNFLMVTAMSWFFSLAYGLDADSSVAHYPVASCLGALIGSVSVNSFSMVSCLFEKYKTL